VNIFKDKKFLDTEKGKDVKLLTKIFNFVNRILLGVGILFNGSMMFMMMLRFSPIFFLFLVNTYFLVMAWKGRKLKIT
jgi:hypothetical protein